jgi:N6-adenosine-specific RNA methylase IME4
MNELEKYEWYKELVSECKAIITEAVFTSRWALVEGYHQLGKRIREDNNVKKYAKGSKTFVQDLGQKIGISTSTLYYALQAYDKYPDLQKIPEGKNITWNKLITKYLPEQKENKIELPLPRGKYNVIYADPPWQYSNSGISGAAENHYPTMSIEELSKLEIPSSDNSVLFLWVTNPILFEAMTLIASWGFEYKTNMVWVKDIAGQGFYVKGQHELLLICVKGSMRPLDSLYVRSVVSMPRQKHSQKPTKFYEIIEELYPKGKYLELFARNKRKGWTSWGNEV